MYGKYSLQNLIKAYSDNKDIINAKLQGFSVENMDMNDGGININVDSSEVGKVLGLSIGIFIFLFLFTLIIWIWALIALISNWKVMPVWAAIIGLVCLLTGFGGPIVTLILVYATRGKK